MKILIVGNGGREHALVWKVYNSQSFKKTNSKLFFTSGNPGITEIAELVDIKPADINSLKEFALKNKIDFTIVGPEVPLSLGIVDEFEKSGLKIFGPSKYAAQLESSKIFAKDFMKEAKIPTAGFKSFNENNIEDVYDYLDEINFPAVIKADGLAAGKGVIIVSDAKEARQTIKELTLYKIFGDAGTSFVIEEFLNGYELSIFVITDGKDYVILPSSQDHKKIGDGDTGKNTGGMGAYSPAGKLLDDKLIARIKTTVIEPALKKMQEKGAPYKGCLYCGLMISEKNGEKEPFVIEFNARFGDPETQAVLPLVKSDFLELLLASAEGRIKDYKLEIFNSYACCVVIASKGYPDKYETGKEISGLKNITNDCIVFQSGTKYDENNDNKILTAGGRVLSVVCTSEVSMKEAITKCYGNVSRINFENMYYRKDIGSMSKEELVMSN